MEGRRRNLWGWPQEELRPQMSCSPQGPSDGLVGSSVIWDDLHTVSATMDSPQLWWQTAPFTSHTCVHIYLKAGWPEVISSSSLAMRLQNSGKMGADTQQGWRCCCWSRVPPSTEVIGEYLEGVCPPLRTFMQDFSSLLCWCREHRHKYVTLVCKAHWDPQSHLNT